MSLHSEDASVVSTYIYVLAQYSTAVCFCLYTRYIYICGHLKKNAQRVDKWRTIKSLVQKKKNDFTVDEGKERLNPSREKN